MPVTSNLDIPLLAVGQTDKETYINEGLEAFAKNLSAYYELDGDAVVGAAQTLTLPYDNTNELTDRSGLRYMFMEITGAASDPFNVEHPDVAHLFVVLNNSGETATFDTATGGTTVDVTDGEYAFLYTDGTDFHKLALGGGGGTSYYDIGGGSDTTPTSDEVLDIINVPRTVTFPADFSGSLGTIEVNPTATFAIDVKDDAVSIGTISISTGGVFTFTTVSGTEKIVAAGSKVTFVAPTTVDATAAGISYTLAGLAS